MSRALILTEQDDPWGIPPPSDLDLVVALFWVAPETLESLSARFQVPVLPAADVVDDLAGLEEESFDLANAVCRSIPMYRDVNPLLGHENRLADLILPHIAARRLLSHLESRLSEDSTLVFPRGGIWADAVAVRGAFKIERMAPRATTASRAVVARGGRFLRDVVASRDVASLLQEPIERLGPRFRPPRPIHVRRGGSWAYSSYVNFSRALARHEARHMRAFQWLINGWSARRGLSRGAQPMHLWDFRGLRSRTEHRATLTHLAPRLTETLVQEGMPSSSITDIVTEMVRAVSDVLKEIDLQSSFVEKVRPEEIWVANQWGSELSLIQIAHRASIPITQVQHGVLEHNYRWCPIYTERFLVWGEAWKDAIPDKEKPRVSILNPGSGGPDAVGPRTDPPDRRVTFFTAPATQSLWNSSVLLQESSRLIADLLAKGWDVTIRVHPNDSVRVWRGVIRRLGPGVSNRVRIDQRTDMSLLLAQTDVALMFRSTVFLGCAVAGIRNVALGWYAWAWDDLMKRTRVVELAGSIDDAVQRCTKERDGAGSWTGDLTYLLAKDG